MTLSIKTRIKYYLLIWLPKRIECESKACRKATDIPTTRIRDQRERQSGHNLMIILVAIGLLLGAGMRRVTNQFGRLAKYGSQFAAAILTNIF